MEDAVNTGKKLAKRDRIAILLSVLLILVAFYTIFWREEARISSIMNVLEKTAYGTSDRLSQEELSSIPWGSASIRVIDSNRAHEFEGTEDIVLYDSSGRKTGTMSVHVGSDPWVFSMKRILFTFDDLLK